MVEMQRSNEGARLLLSPNRSANWRQTQGAIAVIGLVVLLVGIGWTLAGAWVVLPFAGIEVAVVAYVLHRVSFSTYRKQVITVHANRITIESGVRRPTESFELQRPAFLLVDTPDNALHPIKLVLADDYQEVIIGEFLNHEDRAVARHRLAELGLIECSRRWWRR